MAGDHLFDWVPKALAANPEILLFVGESVRAKYFKERSRKERPDPRDYIYFLNDVGAAYKACGECFAYRGYQLEDVSAVRNGVVPFINLQRHPYVWLFFYVQWRVNNMNMDASNTMAIEHEWSILCHQKFRDLNLVDYHFKDVHIWATLQGFEIINRMQSDLRILDKTLRIEDLATDQSRFEDFVRMLTGGRVCYTKELLTEIFTWVDTPFRENSMAPVTAEVLDSSQWPDWKRHAFDKLVSPEAITLFESLGYEL